MCPNTIPKKVLQEFLPPRCSTPLWCPNTISKKVLFSNTLQTGFPKKLLEVDKEVTDPVFNTKTLTQFSKNF
jgi:hypothetical protein